MSPAKPLSIYPSTQVSIKILRKKPTNLLEETERHIIGIVLVMTEGKRTLAAKILGCSLRAIRMKIRRYNLESRIKNVNKLSLSHISAMNYADTCRDKKFKMIEAAKKVKTNYTKKSYEIIQEYEASIKAQKEITEITKNTSDLLKKMKSLNLDASDNKNLLKVMEQLDNASDMINEHLTNKIKETKRK